MFSGIQNFQIVKTSGRMAAVPAAHAQSPSKPAADLQDAPNHSTAAGAAVFGLVTFSVTVWRARREPGNLAFIFCAYGCLAALLLFLRRAQTLTPDSPTGQRRRLHAAVWALSAALSCAFAYRVSLLMPAALVVLVWCMTSFVVLFGFHLLVLCNDQQYQSLDDVDIEKIKLSDEMV
jgi:hypothetical protein